MLTLATSAPACPLMLGRTSSVVLPLATRPLTVPTSSLIATSLRLPLASVADGAVVSMVTARLAVLPTLPALSTTRAW